MKPLLAALIITLAVGVPANWPALASPLADEPRDRSNAGTISTETLRPSHAPSSEPAGNPLWAIPLATLSETRTRPLFTPSRRTPAAPMAFTPPAQQPRTPPKPAAPERPRLALVGTIVGGSRGFGLFIDSSTKAAVRLKTGAVYQGWLLRAVREREVVLEKNHLSTTLSLPAPQHAKAASRPVGTLPHR